MKKLGWNPAGLAFGQGDYPDYLKEPRPPACPNCRDTMHVPRARVIDGREVIAYERCPDPCPAREKRRKSLEAEKKDLDKGVNDPIFPPDLEQPKRKAPWYDENEK